MSLWNEFRKDLVDLKKENALEAPFQKAVEFGLRLLGWSIFDEIHSKEAIPVGNRNSIIPDIVLFVDGCPKLVFEIKKPNHVFNESTEKQLASYAKQYNLQYGIYIGEDIRIFKIKDFHTQEMAVKIKYDEDCELGNLLMSHLERQKFSYEKFAEFCETQLMYRTELWKVRANLEGDAFETTIKDIIRKYYLLIGFPETSINDLLYNISFDKSQKEAYHKQLIQQFEKTKESEKNSATKEEQLNVEVPAKKADPLHIFASKSFFSLNGSEPLKKKYFLREVVQTYICEHPEMDFKTLEKVFHSTMLGHLKYGVIRTPEFIKKTYPQKYLKNGSHKFYLTSDSDLLCSSDGVKFAICTQWKDFAPVIQFAIDQGWEVR